MSDKQTNGNEKPCTSGYNDLPRFTALIEQVKQKQKTTQNTTDHNEQQENGSNGK